jgi:hypothetical protein
MDISVSSHIGGRNILGLALFGHGRRMASRALPKSKPSGRNIVARGPAGHHATNGRFVFDGSMPAAFESFTLI